MATLDKPALDTLFNEARTYRAWHDTKIDPTLLKQVFDLAKMAPTSSNCQPMRLVFVVSPEAKEKLRPCLAAGNIDKTMTAAATAIIGYDLAFYELLPRFSPHSPKAKDGFVGNPQAAFDTAFRNGSLQGAYFILAARALGLDCGPMSGFDNAKVDAAFFAGTQVKSNFLCNLGYGDASKLFPRDPRPEFNEFCRVE